MRAGGRAAMADRTPAEWFGVRVAAERDRRGWSMRELCAAAQVPMAPSTIRRIETGHEVWLSIAVRVARALGLSLDQAVHPPYCEQCNDMPPEGFTCKACGLEAVAVQVTRIEEARAS